MSSYSGFVYLWTCKKNGKKYLGSHKGTIDDGYLGGGKLFKRAIQKYGLKQFTREIVEYVQNENDITVREQYWLTYYDVTNRKDFYNIASSSRGGNGVLDGKSKKELREIAEKKSISQKRRYAENPHLRHQMSRPQKKGGEAHRAKPVMIDGVLYKCRKDAVEKLGVCYASVSKLASKKFIGQGTKNKTPVTVNGIRYPSMKEAQEKTGYSRFAIRQFKNGN